MEAINLFFNIVSFRTHIIWRVEHENWRSGNRRVVLKFVTNPDARIWKLVSLWSVM